jgi:hypothetical protein
VQAGYSHAQVSLAVLALNGVLAMLAVMAWSRPQLGALAVVAAYLLAGGVYAAVDRMRAFQAA